MRILTLGIVLIVSLALSSIFVSGKTVVDFEAVPAIVGDIEKGNGFVVNTECTYDDGSKDGCPDGSDISMASDVILLDEDDTDRDLGIYTFLARIDSDDVGTFFITFTEKSEGFTDSVSVNIISEPFEATLNFEVFYIVDSTPYPAEDGIISFNGRTCTTTSNGKCSITSDVLIGKTYDYSVEARESEASGNVKITSFSSPADVDPIEIERKLTQFALNPAPELYIEVRKGDFLTVTTECEYNYGDPDDCAGKSITKTIDNDLIRLVDTIDYTSTYEALLNTDFDGDFAISVITFVHEDGDIATRNVRITNDPFVATLNFEAFYTVRGTQFPVKGRTISFSEKTCTTNDNGKCSIVETIQQGKTYVYEISNEAVITKDSFYISDYESVINVEPIQVESIALEMKVNPLTGTLKKGEAITLEVSCRYDQEFIIPCEEEITYAISSNYENVLLTPGSSNPGEGSYLFYVDLNAQMSNPEESNSVKFTTESGVSATALVLVVNEQLEFECPTGQCAADPVADDSDCVLRGGYHVDSLDENGNAIDVENCMEFGSITRRKCCAEKISCERRYDGTGPSEYTTFGKCINPGTHTCGENNEDDTPGLCQGNSVCCKDLGIIDVVEGGGCSSEIDCGDGMVCLDKDGSGKKCSVRNGDQAIQWIAFSEPSITILKGDPAPTIPIECYNANGEEMVIGNLCNDIIFDISNKDAGTITGDDPYIFELDSSYIGAQPASLINIYAQLKDVTAITTINSLTVNIQGLKINTIELKPSEPVTVKKGGQVQLTAECKDYAGKTTACTGLEVTSSLNGMSIDIETKTDKYEIEITVPDPYDRNTYDLEVSADGKKASKVITILIDKSTRECGSSANDPCINESVTEQCRCSDGCYGIYKVRYSNDGNCKEGGTYLCRDNNEGYQCVSNTNDKVCSDAKPEKDNSDCGNDEVCCFAQKYEDLKDCEFGEGFDCSKPTGVFPCKCPEKCRDHDEVRTAISQDYLTTCGGSTDNPLRIVGCGEEKDKCPEDGDTGYDASKICICANNCEKRGEPIKPGEECGDQLESVDFDFHCGNTCNSVQGCICPGYCTEDGPARLGETCGESETWQLSKKFKRLNPFVREKGDYWYFSEYFIDNFFRAADPYLMSYFERKGWNDWWGTELLDSMGLDNLLFWKPERWEVLVCKLKDSFRDIPQVIDTTYGGSGTLNLNLSTVRYVLQAEVTDTLPDNTTTYQFVWKLRLEENTTFALSVHYCGREEGKQEEYCPDDKDVTEYNDITYITDPETEEEMSSVFIEVSKGETISINDFKSINNDRVKDTFCITYLTQTRYNKEEAPIADCVTINLEDFTKESIDEGGPATPKATRASGEGWLTTGSSGDGGF